MNLQFLGAAETVTGSKYLLQNKNHKILIDCGLFQGLKTLRLKNWAPFPTSPEFIECIILTHAHIDHSGYIPRLVRDGFKGKIYCTPPTKEMCRVLLLDSAKLMEEEANYLNQHKKSKHETALPLFTSENVEKALELFHVVPFNEKKIISSDLSFEFNYAGHILGAASVIVAMDDKKIAFTGDIGRANDLVLNPPELLPPVDYLVTESTYGNRLHKDTDLLEDLAKIINKTYKRKGVLLIPSFAVGRAQTLLYCLMVLKKQKRIPNFPMFLNGPMAKSVSKIFCDYSQLHKISKKETEAACNVVTYINNVLESKALNLQKGPMLIIASSGMLTGGRILHHLKAFASDPKTTILLTGHQAAGTRGEALLQGAEEIKVHGEYIPVRAEIQLLNNVSAHADYKEIIDWFMRSKIAPKKVFVTHGEPAAADELRRRLEEKFHWNCLVPRNEEIVTLE